MTSGWRTQRLGELVARELAGLLLRDLKDPRLRGVTITEARMSPDLRHCRVFFSHLEGPQRGQEALQGFASAAGFIRSHISRALKLRYAPEFQFELDVTFDRAARIDQLLRESRNRG